jgi:HD superfamily phosphohydrolases
MPKWGLTEEHRAARPWGLDPALLAPGKIITEPVHGDICVHKLEALLLDSRPMQRLRRVRQLGTMLLV